MFPTLHAAAGSDAPPIMWSRVFLAIPAQVREARRFLATVLAGCPAADDAILCLSELASNAAVHSRSREPGGHFTVCVQVTEVGRIRVEVVDEGGPWPQPVRRDGQHGRGLLIVSQLARDWGRAGDAATGWTVWFELVMTGPCDRPGQP